MRTYKHKDYYEQTETPVKKCKLKPGAMWKWIELGPTDMKTRRSKDKPTERTMERAIALCAEKCPWTQEQVGVMMYVINGVKYTPEQIKEMRTGVKRQTKTQKVQKADNQQIRYWRA